MRPCVLTTYVARDDNAAVHALYLGDRSCIYFNE